MDPIIVTRELKKVYRMGRVQVPALRGVDCTVLESEFVAVVGPSGCGKSTLLHILGGLTGPTSGEVLVDGNDFSNMTDADRTRFRRHTIGFVFQRFNLLPTLTARNNIAIAQDIQGNGFNPHHFQKVSKCWASRTSLSIDPMLCRAANNNAWPSLARSFANPRYSWRMSRQAIWTRRIRRQFST